MVVPASAFLGQDSPCNSLSLPHACVFIATRNHMVTAGPSRKSSWRCSNLMQSALCRYNGEPTADYRWQNNGMQSRAKEREQFLAGSRCYLDWLGEFAVDLTCNWVG